jgi:hypothetical protein
MTTDNPKPPEKIPDVTEASSEALCYTAGQHVWFLKSMRMCSFVEENGDKTCTVMRLDTGKKMTATYDGIEAV